MHNVVGTFCALMVNLMHSVQYVLSEALMSFLVWFVDVLEFSQANFARYSFIRFSRVISMKKRGVGIRPANCPKTSTIFTHPKRNPSILKAALFPLSVVVGEK